MASQDQNSTSHETAQSADSNNNSSNSDIILQLPNGLGVRRYRYADIKPTARHANNRNVWRNLRDRMPQPYSENDAKEWVDRMSSGEHDVPSGAWTLETGSQGPRIPACYAITVDGEAAGSIGLTFEDAKDVHARCAEIGYWLGEEHWGKGVMSAVVPAFVQWAWETFGILVRLEADTYDRNVHSRRILEKAGFQREGVKKWAYMKEGVIGDVVLLAMTRPGMKQ